MKVGFNMSLETHLTTIGAKAGALAPKMAISYVNLWIALQDWFDEVRKIDDKKATKSWWIVTTSLKSAICTKSPIFVQRVDFDDFDEIPDVSTSCGHEFSKKYQNVQYVKKREKFVKICLHFQH